MRIFFSLFLLTFLSTNKLSASNSRCCQLISEIYQLETNTTAILLLTDELGTWGSFGLGYGFRYYPDENGSASSGSQDLAFVWQLKAPLVEGTKRRILISSDLKFGQTVYDSEVLAPDQSSKHGFFESNIGFITQATIDPVFSLGVGVGWRVNFLDGDYQRQLKQVNVYADWLYPMMYFAWNLPVI